MTFLKQQEASIFFLVNFDEIPGKILASFEIIGTFTTEISASFYSREISILTAYLQDIGLIHTVDHSCSLILNFILGTGPPA